MNYWVQWGYPIEVRYMQPNELGDYQSNYLRCWNYCRDCGWNKVDGMWVSPDGTRKYATVYEAYNSQKFKEMTEQNVTTKNL